MAGGILGNGGDQAIFAELHLAGQGGGIASAELAG